MPHVARGVKYQIDLTHLCFVIKAYFFMWKTLGILQNIIKYNNPT